MLSSSLNWYFKFVGNITMPCGIRSQKKKKKNCDGIMECVHTYIHMHIYIYIYEQKYSTWDELIRSDNFKVGPFRT